jgi:excisionase family DNA binding protein
MIEKVGYSIEEAAQSLGVGRTTVYDLMNSGDLESVKVGRRRIIPADAIGAFLVARRAAAAEADARVPA